MKYNRIIYLLEAPMLQRDYERFGIQEIEEQGLKVRILDLSPILLPLMNEKIKAGVCDYIPDKFVVAHTFYEYKEIIDRLDVESDLIVCLMGYRGEYRRVFSYIKKKKLHFCYYLHEMSSTDFCKVERSLKNKLTLKNIRRAIYNRIPKYLQNISYADFIIACGGDDNSITNFKKRCLCKKDCKIYYVHSANYDECLKDLGTKRIVKYQYFVFIDQYLPYHTDNIDNNVIVNDVHYYEMLNSLFDYLERIHSLRCVIATHPSSDYETHPKCFGNREIIKNATSNLVQYADFVIYHFSNSLSYITLYHKPVLIVANDDMLRYFSNQIRAVANELGAKWYNPDHDKIEDINDFITLNSGAYTDYIKRYMRADYSGNIKTKRLTEKFVDIIQSL